MDAKLAADMKFRIAVSRRMLYRHGLDSQIGGHVSLRVPGEDAFFVTPFQYFDECLPEHVSKVGFDLKVREPGTLPASPGINFHASIYRHRPDVHAAIHTHSDKISILSSAAKPLDVYYAPGAIFLDDIGYFEDNGEVLPDEEGELIAGVLGGKRAVFMKHHGAVHVGASLEQVTVETILLEKCANYQIEAMSIGAKPMPAALAGRYRERYLGNGFQRREWDAYLRQLKRSDPALFAA
jgi:L-fuculose-phosphate aldolase